MKEIIDKYIRKHTRIEGRVMQYVDWYEFEARVMDIFSISGFDLMKWLTKELGENHAIQYKSGEINWWKGHMYHRLDGPAIIFPNGDEHYYIDDVEYAKKDYYVRINR